MSNHRQSFNEILKEFNANPTQNNHSAIGKLYDLKDELEQQIHQHNFNNDMVLFSVYNTLGLFASAYEIYQKHHHPNTPKIQAQLYKIAQKAKSHGNHFALKDIRQEKANLKKSKTNIILTTDDFKLDLEQSTDKDDWFTINKKIPIFWKEFKSKNEKIKVIIPKNSLESHLSKITEIINHFAYLEPNILIDYYNNPPQNEHSYTIQNTQIQADENWFYALEIYGFKICTYGDTHNLSFEVVINMGDIYDINHILTLEFNEAQLFMIYYG